MHNRSRGTGVVSKLKHMARRTPVLRRCYRALTKPRRTVQQAIARSSTVDKTLIFFESFGGRSFADSPKAIYEALLADERFSAFHFVWSFDHPENHRAEFDTLLRTTLVTHNTKAYRQALHKAKYWVVNDLVALETAKLPTQVMLQCWHGTPLKRLRSDVVEGTRNATNSRADFVLMNKLDVPRWDHLISPSPYASRVFTTAFDLEQLGKTDILLEVGYPRNEALYHPDQERLEELRVALDLPTDKKIILYAPTWRDDQYDVQQGYTYRATVDFDHLREELGDEYVLLFRGHYYIKSGFDLERYQGFVKNVSDYDDVNDLFLLSDVLVTDYSSVCFDYANLDKPMIFFMYDKEHYEEELRGFYFSESVLPGEIVRTEQELAVALKDLRAYTEAWSDKRAEFRAEFAPLDGDHPTQKVIDRVFLADQLS